MTDTEKYRPPPEERWTRNVRTLPGQIRVRTRFLYSEPDPRVVVPAGETRHAFSRGSDVTASDWPGPDYWQATWDHLQRAIASFGDDADLVIEVRRATPELATLVDHALALPAVMDEVRANRMIHAIKELRAATRAHLRDAKAAIEDPRVQAHLPGCHAVIRGRRCGKETCATVHMDARGHDYQETPHA